MDPLLETKILTKYVGEKLQTDLITMENCWAEEDITTRNRKVTLYTMERMYTIIF